MSSVEKLELRDVVDEMSSGFQRHLPLIVRITVLFAALNAVSGLLNVAGPAGVAISAGIFVLLSAAYGGMITALLCLPHREPIEQAGQLWTMVTPLLARLIWVTLITIVAVVAGAVALIIPGLIFATLLAVAAQVVVAERLGTFASLGRSAYLVRGNGFRVFGFIMLVGIVSLAAIILIASVVLSSLGSSPASDAVSGFIQNLFLGPLLAVGPAALYNSLTAVTRPDSTDQPM